MKTVSKVALSALTLLTLSTAQASAQTCTANPCSLNDTVKVTVATVLRLMLSQAATPLTAPNEAAYDAGYELDNGPSVSVKANRAWTVKVSSNASIWTGTGGASTTKAAGDLQWATAVGGPYTAFSTTPATFLTGSGTGSTSQQAYYKALWSYSSDTPGDYSLVVVYTLSAP